VRTHKACFLTYTYFVSGATSRWSRALRRTRCVRTKPVFLLTRILSRVYLQGGLDRLLWFSRARSSVWMRWRVHASRIHTLPSAVRVLPGATETLMGACERSRAPYMRSLSSLSNGRTRGSPGSLGATTNLVEWSAKG